MTTLKEQINKDLIQAMKDKDTLKKGVLQLVKAGIQNAQIEAKKDFNDEDVIKVIQREMKQINQSIEGFKQGYRPLLVQAEEYKLKVLKRYLPTQLTDFEIASKLIENGVKKGMNMGEAMKIAKQVISQGSADSKLVSQVAKNLTK